MQELTVHTSMCRFYGSCSAFGAGFRDRGFHETTRFHRLRGARRARGSRSMGCWTDVRRQSRTPGATVKTPAGRSAATSTTACRCSRACRTAPRPPAQTASCRRRSRSRGPACATPSSWGQRPPQILGGEPAEMLPTDPREPQSEDCLVMNIWTPNPAHGQPAGDGVAARRRLRQRFRQLLDLRGRELARKHDVVAISVNHRLNVLGFLYLAQYRRQVGRRLQRRHARHRRGAGVGARQHRGLRRRPAQRDDLRPVGRRRQGQHADGDAVGARAVPSRDRAERRGADRDARDAGGQDHRAGPAAAEHQARPARSAADDSVRADHRRAAPGRRRRRLSGGARPGGRRQVAAGRTRSIRRRRRSRRACRSSPARPRPR